ncbi:o-succinylbenzoate--CoA ligase [Vespertiliibacter pulmonis]|uniref:2-succinylbenzoyl-CoA synthetase n=1 Tax=Vespertiliibacter pulmonis TaxID=1443036 RepID=A0A3N4WJI7_9PAST|nr:o-succinylbenzoate--CoA ligase [Vespertiliibacter pulmonis]QLB20129.1 o-succinylbenzoate--CoA ligase [Vespertiliibacter pulmonis]RPE86100.1 2-succinylbenzoyl-CoA synthetase [Vespertiliibacter pulmonis]
MIDFPVFPTAYWADKDAHKTAIVWKKGNSDLFPFLSEHISWQNWHCLLEQAVFLLKNKGVSAQSLIAYSGSHRLAGLICYLSALLLGARVLMLNPAISINQKREILKNNGVHYCFDDIDFTHFQLELTACQLHRINLQAPATFTLTSGSSGFPKAVVHTIHQHLENAQGVCELMNFQQGNSWLLSLPLFHVSGQGIIWRWLSVGATLWINEEKNDFFVSLAQVSHASLVPTQLQRYLQQTEVSVGNHQKILLGGAFIPAELIIQAQTRQIETYAGYGMTEMASTICAVKNERHHVGKPLQGRRLKIDEQGEIWVRGAGLGLGYWIDQTIIPFTNQQGWFATKDKGELRYGNLVVIGRRDNLFISGGENIQPEEIERVLFQSGLVKQAFIVPVDDREFGQRPVAVVEFLEPFSPQAVFSLENFARQHLEKFKLPIAYFPLETLSHTGFKISRKYLQQQVALKLREKNNV